MPFDCQSGRFLSINQGLSDKMAVIRETQREETEVGVAAMTGAHGLNTEAAMQAPLSNSTQLGPFDWSPILPPPSGEVVSG